ncbi:MAG TPA: glycosyltransferase, partial [Candidatus Acidoferrales bacterium]|nr:glycosyltransferase [Candidatus Acidoferrales bacterium]
DMNEIVFLDRQPFDYVLKRYAAADIFVLPGVTASHGGRDITPNVLMEAMAMKLPVVSTISGAIPEVVENGVSGLLVPPHDEQALAGALVRLIQEPGLRQTYGRNGRRRVEERFDVAKNATAFVSLFGQTY